MTIQAGDVIRIALTGTAIGSNVFQNVWHYFMVSGAGIEPDDAFLNIESNFAQAFAFLDDLVSDEFSWDSLQMWKRDVNNHLWDGQGEELMVGLVGLEANDPLPHGVAAVCRYVTNALRRQGRHFIPGITENETLAGNLTASAITALGNYMDEFTDVLSPVGGVLRLCTYNTDPLSTLYESASAYADTYYVNEILGYQRRRKPLVGI